MLKSTMVDPPKANCLSLSNQFVMGVVCGPGGLHSVEQAQALVLGDMSKKKTTMKIPGAEWIATSHGVVHEKQEMHHLQQVAK